MTRLSDGQRAALRAAPMLTEDDDPIRLLFAGLDAAERARVLAAADFLHLPVAHDDENQFVVTVPDASIAYVFGRASAGWGR